MVKRAGSTRVFGISMSQMLSLSSSTCCPVHSVRTLQKPSPTFLLNSHLIRWHLLSTFSQKSQSGLRVLPILCNRSLFRWRPLANWNNQDLCAGDRPWHRLIDHAFTQSAWSYLVSCSVLMSSGRPVSGSLRWVILLSSILVCQPLVEMDRMLSLLSSLASLINWKNSSV